MNKKPTGNKVEREAHLRWVPMTKMRINPLAQRELNNARVDKLVAEMELEQLGNLTVNCRDGWYYIMDGQHRKVALQKWLGEGSWEDQQLQCWTYEGENALTPAEEAEWFLKLNDTLNVTTFDKFTKGIQAGRAEESDIDRIVRALGLKISKAKGGGAIGSVATLRKVYRHGPTTLSRSLRIIRDAYGDAGFTAGVIEGLGLLCQRYNGELDEERAVEKLAAVHGGLNGLLNSAESLRQKTGHQLAHCTAAAAVDIYNRGRGAGKLPSWWRGDA